MQFQTGTIRPFPPSRPRPMRTRKTFQPSPCLTARGAPSLRDDPDKLWRTAVEDKASLDEEEEEKEQRKHMEEKIEKDGLRRKRVLELSTSIIPRLLAGPGKKKSFLIVTIYSFSNTTAAILQKKAFSRCGVPKKTH